MHASPHASFVRRRDVLPHLHLWLRDMRGLAGGGRIRFAVWDKHGEVVVDSLEQALLRWHRRGATLEIEIVGGAAYCKLTATWGWWGARIQSSSGVAPAVNRPTRSPRAIGRMLHSQTFWAIATFLVTLASFYASREVG